VRAVENGARPGGLSCAFFGRPGPVPSEAPISRVLLVRGCPIFHCARCCACRSDVSVLFRLGVYARFSQMEKIELREVNIALGIDGKFVVRQGRKKHYI
jgi:hypothetical protein